jgi:cation:H+ antiporter
LLALFAIQFAIPGQTGRYVLSGIYLALALIALVRHRRQILPTLAAPFRAAAKVPAEPTDELVSS